MKTILRKLTVAMGVFLMGTMLSGKASADCGSVARPKAGAAVQPQSWQGIHQFQQGSLQLVSDHDDDPMVGMWQVKFIVEGNTGSMAPPDDTVIDNAFVQWHSDGTEIMNSGRPAQDGNFCLGVWKRTGKSSYKLNHFALGNTPDNAPSGIGNPAGPTQIQENIALSRDGNCYSGWFTLDAYDTSGHNVAHIIGKISATRVTINTSANSVM